MNARLAAVALAAMVALPGCSGDDGGDGFRPQPGDAPWYADSPCATLYDRHFVYDFAELIPFAGDAIERDACDLYAQTGVHAVFVTVAQTGGESLDSWAPKLVRSWGIGDKDRQDGLLLVYALDDGAGVPVARVEVGYGLESVISAPIARQAVEAMREERARAIANGSSGHEEAMLAGALVLLNELFENAEAHPPEPADVAFGFSWWWVVLAIAILVILVLASRSSGGGRMGGGRMGGGRMGGGFGGGRSGGWGGGSRGGGSGGFGGGKSGGGGHRGRL